MNFYPVHIDARWAKLTLDHDPHTAIQLEVRLAATAIADLVWYRLTPKQAAQLREKLAELLAADGPDIHVSDTVEFGSRAAKLLNDVETGLADTSTADGIRDEIRSLLRLASPAAAGL